MERFPDYISYLITIKNNNIPYLFIENYLAGYITILQVESLKFLEESTNTLIQEQQDKRVKTNMVRLLDMKAQSIQVYGSIYK